jgi:hypothetical protein
VRLRLIRLANVELGQWECAGFVIYSVCRRDGA